MTTADLLGKILQVVMGLAVFAAVVGLLIFFIDKAPKKGRDYWQLAGSCSRRCSSSRSAWSTRPSARASSRSRATPASWTLDNFVWMFTQPAGHPHAHQHDHLGDARPDRSRRSIGLAYAVFIDKSRGEQYYKVLVFMPIAISFVGAGIIWSSSTSTAAPSASRSAC